jgi:hypothetical protein
LKLPIRLTSMTRRNASSGSGPSRPTIRPGVPTPAQLTAMRAGPCRWRDGEPAYLVRRGGGRRLVDV